MGGRRADTEWRTGHLESTRLYCCQQVPYALSDDEHSTESYILKTPSCTGARATHSSRFSGWTTTGYHSGMAQQIADTAIEQIDI